MSNTNKTPKTTEEQIAIKNDKILKLKNEKKAILQRQKTQERKARNNRLFRRHGLLEFFMPNLCNITDEQFETFIRKGINTKYGREKLAEIIDEGAEAAASYIAKCRNNENATGDTESPEAFSPGA